MEVKLLSLNECFDKMQKINILRFYLISNF
jgi:hypothetical protein